MKNIFCMLLLLFSFSCSNSLDEYEGYGIDFRDKSFKDVSHVGASCSTGCIYSKYAVEYNFQEKQKDCVEGPCACVVNGDVFTLCNEDSPPESLWGNVEEVEEESSIIDIPYYNQYDNVYSPSATCQNTSIAMVLSHFQYDILPDDIFLRWGKDKAQSPSGLNSVYKDYAATSEINTYTNATPEELISALQRGYIAIVHGYFTSSGHVLVVRGYDGNSYYVNDPAGKWNECFKCGYAGSSYNGVTKYSKESFESAVFTSNGTAYLPGWIHLIRGY